MRSRIRGLQQFLREAVDMSLAGIRGGDPLLLGGSVGYFAFDVASLGASFEALGSGGLPLGTFVLAYVLGHGGALIPLPGSAEGGLLGMYTAYGSPLSLAVGAILVYRTFHAGHAGHARPAGLRRHPAAQAAAQPGGDRPAVHEPVTP